jgi:hypothetical protein
MGGGASGDGQLEQRLKSAGHGAKESSMKSESAKSENRPVHGRKTRTFLDRLNGILRHELHEFLATEPVTGSRHGFITAKLARTF